MIYYFLSVRYCVTHCVLGLFEIHYYFPSFHTTFIKKLNFFDRENMKKPPSKVAHNRPKLCFHSPAQPTAQCAQPRIDFLYYKYNPRHICFLICGNMLHQSHCIEVAQGDIFMEQKMRFGLVLGRLWATFEGGFFSCFQGQKNNLAFF